MLKLINRDGKWDVAETEDADKSYSQDEINEMAKKAMMDLFLPADAKPDELTLF